MQQDCCAADCEIPKQAAIKKTAAAEQRLNTRYVRSPHPAGEHNVGHRLRLLQRRQRSLGDRRAAGAAPRRIYSRAMKAAVLLFKERYTASETALQHGKQAQF